MNFSLKYFLQNLADESIFGTVASKKICTSLIAKTLERRDYKLRPVDFIICPEK